MDLAVIPLVPVLSAIVARCLDCAFGPERE
jgi:hypothetical protein